MQIKQLYASLEIATDEIRLVVSEFYMSRFNVLKVEKTKIKNINNNIIENQPLISAAISKTIKNAEVALNLKIKSVILSIPSVDVKCLKKRVNVAIEEGSRKIQMSHVRMGLNKAIEYEIQDQYEFVNVGSITYIIGGISSRSIPLEEKAEMLTMDIDLIYANKDIVYSYVAAVEKAGIQVLDICLDSFALAEESATLENSMDKSIILLNLKKNETILSLYYKGRMLECGKVKKGYGNWIDSLHKKYHLSLKECENIIKENCFDEKGIYDDNVSYIWLDRDQHNEITKREIFMSVKDEVNLWINEVNEVCQPIIQTGNCKCVLSGEGADIVGLASIISKLSVDTQIYIPNTIGVREGKLATCLGSLYCIKKAQQISNHNDVCIEYSNVIAREQRKEDANGFTEKLKKILQVK